VGKHRRSALEAFDGCPFRYQQLYIEGVEDRGDESQRGIAFHEIAFQYIKRLAAARVPADSEEAEAAMKEGVAASQLPAHLVHEVAALWRRFSEWFQLDLDAYMAAEEKQESERFTWIPDLVYVRPQGVELKDWKTYYKGLTLEQARKEFQAKFYLVMAIDTWPGFPSYTFTFNFVRLGYEVSVTMTAEEIEAFRGEVEAIMLSLEEATRTNNWPAIPGSHCTLCRLVCPIVDNPRRLPVRLTSADEAQSAGGEILVLEQRLKALKKSLGGWCTQEGPVIVNGQMFSHRPSVTRSYPAGVVVDLLRELYPSKSDSELTILDQANLLQVSATAVTKADPLKMALGKAKGSQAATEHPDLQGKVLEGTRWSFRHSKAGAIEDEDGGDE